MLENTYKSTSTDRAGVRLLMPFVLLTAIKDANFIRALNLNFRPFSYALLVQDKFVSS